VTVLEFVAAVVQVRLVVAFSVGSWVRTSRRNKDVGGDPWSRHLDACAVDAYPDDPADRERAARECKRVGLVLVDEGDHWHLQPAG